MARRPVAVVSAIVLVLEGFGLAGLNWFLGEVVRRQQMSLAGLPYRGMQFSTWGLAAVVLLYLLVCAFILLSAAIGDRDITGLRRILLIVAAVVHGVLGALCVSLVGWTAFAFMVVVLGLIVFCLVAFDEQGWGPRPRRSGSGGRPWRPGWLRVPDRLRRSRGRTA